MDTTLQSEAEAVDRWLAWAMWDTDTEWTAEGEAEYNAMVLRSVELDIAINGMGDYTAEDLANYRAAAAA